MQNKHLLHVGEVWGGIKLRSDAWSAVRALLQREAEHSKKAAAAQRKEAAESVVALQIYDIIW